MGTKTPNFATLPEMIFDAFSGWKHEGLPPVKVPSAAQWKFRSKPFRQVILDYDCGSDMVELHSHKNPREEISEGSSGLHWEDCTLWLDVATLTCVTSNCESGNLDKFGFFSVSIILESHLLVDGVLLRLWDTRIHCVFGGSAHPAILRERCWKEGTYQSLFTLLSPSPFGVIGGQKVYLERHYFQWCTIDLFVGAPLSDWW
ncbi:hypothetical protein GOBAR_DD05069 [Gossypium barbadense]|nr:hypothetical protein GOBAR_DD05069 [Gossypium barbadense]